MKTLLLQDKVIFLTGGSCGIGRDCAKAYVAEGAKVVVVARDKGGVAEVIAELGPKHLGIVCDVTQDAEVKKAVKKALKKYGRLDAVHNNAGISSPSKPVHETTDAEWDRVFDVNLKGVLHTTRHAFAALVASKGCILNTSSLVGVIGQELHAAYVATKGGLNALTKSMALDYAKHGIRVNGVCPAGVWTPMLRQWCAEQADPSLTARYLDEIHPLGYCPESSVIADACVFLISNKARFITGHLMNVTGGAELGYRRNP
ncbi:MAG TPA: SDR family oxidoreductase [Candidatus Acidoferrales bacterium]|jgi:meso-butanediol dehydrogenase/(S,S)-butanediol dehydrogenase/diacetyl reductase|nr:SDR family oxidoreductase [Candidatus Acidoferrales bacterium]